MGLVEDVQQMQLSGMSEQDIIASLKSRGINDGDISNAISQAKIKNAVNSASADNSAKSEVPTAPRPTGVAPQSAPLPPPATSESSSASSAVSAVQEISSQSSEQNVPVPDPASSSPYPQSPAQSQFEGMSPSMLSQSAPEASSPIPGEASPGSTAPTPQHPNSAPPLSAPSPAASETIDPYAAGPTATAPTVQTYAPTYNAYGGEYVGEAQTPATQEYSYGDYGYDPYAGYQDYQTYQAAGADILSEVVEQVVEEKLVSLRHALDKAIDFQTVAETKLQHIEERLKRIEQVLDKLQISLIQKVGEYVGDVMHLRKEVEETHKTLAREIGKIKHLASTSSGSPAAPTAEASKEKNAEANSSRATFRSLASGRREIP